MSDIVLQSGRLTSRNATIWEKMALAGLKASSKILQPTHFKGYGRIAAVMRRAAPARHIVLELDRDCRFRFPFGDAYWSRLAAEGVVYEPEMLALLRLIRKEAYSFIDCGANFGYWSVLVSGKSLGAHRVVAVEASGKNFEELSANAALNERRFEVVHAAVAEQDGGAVALGGPTHDSLAIVNAANAGPNAESVRCISLDGLVARTPWLDASRRLVLKLDVEGVEEAALRGAADLLSRDTLLIYEEQGSDDRHCNTRFATERLGMRVFGYRDGRFEEAQDPLAAVAAMKTNRRRGYNVVAAKSDAWLSVLRSAAQ